jgi:hypothetical protein
VSTAIRKATVADMPWLLEQLAAFDRFFGSSRSMFPPSMDVAEQKLHYLINDHVFMIAEEAEYGPVGFIAGFQHEDFLSLRPRLTELFWWVAEPYRRSRAGLLLLNAFIAYGRTLGADIAMSLLSGSPVNVDTLTRRGFVPKETSYLLEAP